MTDIGDYLKALEGAEAQRAATKGIPLLARLDGRAFHTFTKGLERPFDARLSSLMVKTTEKLVHELWAHVGYTQSDEISLIWHNDVGSVHDFPFSGRYQKLCSILASTATAYFIKHLPNMIPEKGEQLPSFDCRLWQCSIEDAVKTFKWREADARKNAVSMAASAYFSHKELQGVPTSRRRQMLADYGIDYDAMPTFFTHGTYVYRHIELAPLPPEALAKVPEKHKAEHAVVERTVVRAGTVLSLDDLSNPAEFLTGSTPAVYMEPKG